MASYTPNYSFKKPEQEDMFDVEDTNGNMDILDTQLFSLHTLVANAASEESMAELTERIGTTKNTGGTTTNGTAMAKLNAILTKLASQPQGVIKSIQRGSAFFPTEPKAPVPMELEISPITVEKSIVILNGCASRGYGDSAANAYPYVMSFTSDVLTIGVSGNTHYLGAQFTWDWQIIEFY